MPSDADATQVIADLLAEYGLGGLSDWAWEQIIKGANAAQVYQALRETPEWQDRYQAIVLREQNGLPAISEGQLLVYEREVAQMMARAGMPPGFYDHYTDFIPLVGEHDRSLAEIDAILREAYARVVEAPEEVRDGFRELYGPSGDAALAAYFLDPDKAEPVLGQQARAAEVRGYGVRFGMDVGRDRAEEIARFGLSSSEVRRGVAQASERSPLYRERIGETEDLTAEEEGLDAALGLADADALRQRQERRQAEFSGVGGPGGTRDRGGLGSSER